MSMSRVITAGGSSQGNLPGQAVLAAAKLRGPPKVTESLLALQVRIDNSGEVAIL
jgi:hypothetical protein